MCLITFAWQVIPGRPLIAVANRDEFLDRPTAAAGWWSDFPQVFAGRDLQGGGTWMGITRDGRFAAITNVRAPDEQRTDVRSRGELVSDFLTGTISSEEYVARLAAQADDYNGFNLLVGDCHQLRWFSNRAADDARNGQPILPGIYGLSNAKLDSPWPKVVRSKAEFASLLCQGASDEAFFEMLTDTRLATDCRLPKTGLSIELERALSAVCIHTPGYGTRASTIVRLDTADNASLNERIILQH
ncbi:NRDE family protein [Actimicrobium antarcticum]|uniref:NRDE family protein n=1 Tax=Actimicrobium antarcticum TaxID=1051899 RepID=A0ABP7SHI8_9BURK